VWDGAVQGAAQALVVLGKGQLPAAGIPDNNAEESAVGLDENGCLCLKSQCDFCPLGALCGQIFGQPA
jgi:hypothetical protein